MVVWRPFLEELRFAMTIEFKFPSESQLLYCFVELMLKGKGESAQLYTQYSVESDDRRLSFSDSLVKKNWRDS